MKRISKLPALLLPILLVMSSCFPEFDSAVEDLDLAITSYDQEQNFGDLSTFYLPDTIIYISDDEVEIQREDNDTEELILDQVRTNLEFIGWEELSDTTDEDNRADVAIMVSVLDTDLYYYYTYWWDYWSWYPWDWWYPGYPGYPGYPLYPSYPTYGFTIGSLIIDMVRMKDIVLPPVEEGPSVRFPVVWTGMVNGILSGSESNIQRRLTRQIEQVFLQSDYLHKATIDN